VRRFLLPFVGFIAALSLFSVGAAAAPTTTAIDSASVASPDVGELPAACQLTAATATAGASTTATATPVATATAIATAATLTGDDEDRDDEDRAEDGNDSHHAIRTCIAALHEDGEHGIGLIVSDLAHQINAERHAEHDAEHGRNGDDDAPSEVSATPTPTAAATPVTTTASATAIASPTTTSAHARDQKPEDHKGQEQHGHKHGGD
jgi:hypothetical protein